MRRLCAAVFAGAMLLLAFPEAARADPADYALISDESTPVDGTTLTYTVLNLTAQEARVRLEGAGCDFAPSPGFAPPSRPQKLTFTASGCDLPEDRTVRLTLSIGDTPFSVTSTPSSTPAPDWAVLQSFGWTIIGGIAAVLIGWVWFLVPRRRHRDNPSAPAGPWAPLPYLAAGWSFKESWAANVTLVSALFTGLFGSSDLLADVTGGKAPAALAVITIGSAIGLAVVGVAPVVLQTLRTVQSEVRVCGLLISGALASGAAGGIALVVAASVAPLVHGWANTFLRAGALAALALLAAYTIASVRQNLTAGLTKPPAKEAASLTIRGTPEAGIADDAARRRPQRRIEISARAGSGAEKRSALI